MKRILVISPHPDDLEISMGGTAAKLVEDGNQVKSLIFTDGRRSPRSFKCSDDEMAKLRQEEGKKAHKILGIKNFEYLNLKDLFNNAKVKKIVEKELENKWDEIFIPHPEDLHPTHSKLANLFLKIISQKGHKPKVWAYDGWNFLHSPDRYEDIEKYIKKKVKAIRCFTSQVKDKPYDEAAESLAKVRAILMDPFHITKIKYAEAFKKLV